MKKEFSKNWKSSTKTRKQRKYLANAPLHLKRKTISSNLSKDLRKKIKKRSMTLRKGDEVKILRGKFKGKKGKIILVEIKKRRIEIEGMQVKKRDGSKVNVKIEPSNLQIISLNMDDKKRNKKLNIKENVVEKKQEKPLEKEKINKEPKENKK